MAQADPRIKNLKIHTGVVKRINKEMKMYEKEAADLAKKIVDLERQGADQYVLRKQREVLQESENMVPDTQRRLNKAIKELENLIKMDEYSELSERGEYIAAKTALEEAKTNDQELTVQQSLDV